MTAEKSAILDSSDIDSYMTGYEGMDTATLSGSLVSQASWVKGINYERPHDLMIEAARRVRPRVVSTVAELDALPGLSVIRDSEGRVYEKSYPRDGNGWSGTGGDTDYLTAGMLDFIEFPATVLWVGGTE